MTRNQIEYQKLQETKRQNLVAQELQRQSVDVERLKAQEVSRHNVVSEQQAMSQLGINSRLADYQSINAQANSRNAESNALNATANLQNAQTNARNAEINARNADTNWYSAQSGRIQANAQITQAKAAMLNADTQSLAQMETARHNTVTEHINQLDSASERRYRLQQGGVIASQIAMNKTQSALNQAREVESSAKTDLTRSQTTESQLNAYYRGAQQNNETVKAISSLLGSTGRTLGATAQIVKMGG